MFAGLAAEPFRAPPALRHPQETRIRQFPSRRIFLHTFPRLLGVAFHVEEVIRNLKREAQTAAVRVETVQQLRIGAAGPFTLGYQHAQTQTGSEERASLAAVQLL